MIKRLGFAFVGVMYLAHMNAAVIGLREAIMDSDMVKVQTLIKGLELSGKGKNTDLEYLKGYLPLAQKVAQERKEQGIFKNGWDAANLLGGYFLFRVGIEVDLFLYRLYGRLQKDQKEGKITADKVALYPKIAIPAAGVITAIAASGLWLASKGYYCSRQLELQERAEKIAGLLEEHVNPKK